MIESQPYARLEKSCEMFRANLTRRFGIGSQDV
jgi:hypothetical protein